MKKNKWAVALLVMVLVLGLVSLLVACGEEETTTTAAPATTAPPATAPPTTAPAAADIVDTAVAAGSFNTLVSLVQAAGLVDTLKGDGPFTVFAPTDEAFAAVPQETLDALAADPKGALTSVLTYHVVPGKVMSTDITDGMEATTVEGSTVKFTVKDGMVYVNDAKVVQPDIVTSNGVIHVIDKVLLPPDEGVPDTGQTYDLKFAYGTPSRASLVEAYLTPWTDSITAVTNGRVKVTHYPEDSLVKSEQLWDALLSGTTDIALIEPEFNAGVFPISECGSLPQLFPDAVTAAESYWDVIQEYAKEEWKDVQVLGVTVIAAAQYAGNKEVKVPADMAGMRMRSGGKIETWIVEAVGATPVEISTGDLATSIERGVADGAFVTYSLMLSTGLKDVTKYRTEGNYFYRCWVVAMNKDVWESMPALMQDSIMSVSGKEASALYTTANEKATMGAKKAVEGSDKGAGNPPIYVPTAEEMAQWHEALMPVWDKWIAALPAGTDGQAVIDAVAEFNKANAAQ